MVLGSGVAECTCDNCAMEIIFENLQSSKEEERGMLLKSVINSDFTKQALCDFQNYALQEYRGVRPNEYTKIDFMQTDIVALVFLHFKDSENKEHSVMYAYNKKKV